MIKKIPVLLFSVILSLFVVAAAGCGKANEVVDKSLKYDIDIITYRDEVEGYFKIKVNSGIVVNVKFTVNGYDADGIILWTRNFDEYYNGLEPKDEPYIIEFTYSYPTVLYDTEQRTNSITVTGIKLTVQKSNEWMGWTFGCVSALFTVVVITLFIISKLKSPNETTSENTEISG